MSKERTEEERKAMLIARRQEQYFIELRRNEALRTLLKSSNDRLRDLEGQ